MCAPAPRMGLTCQHPNLKKILSRESWVLAAAAKVQAAGKRGRKAGRMHQNGCHLQANGVTAHGAAPRSCMKGLAAIQAASKGQGWSTAVALHRAWQLASGQVDAVPRIAGLAGGTGVVAGGADVVGVCDVGLAAAG